MKEKKRDIILIIGIIVFTAVAMFLFWNLKLQAYWMPIRHTVSYSGEFTTRIGAVREIVIQHKKMADPVQIDISVYDSKHTKCWENSYKDVVITGGKQTLESFDRENPLQLLEGSYYAEILVDGEKKANLDCHFIEYSGSYKEMYTVLCLLLILGEVLLFLLYRNEKLSLEKVYFCVAIILGLILNFVMPPLGVPDEQSHFMEAYKVSSKLLGQEVYDDKGYLMIREEDYNSITYLYDISGIADWYDTFHIMADADEKVLVSSGYKSTVGTKAPYTYLVPAVGITVARILGCSGHVLLILGRLCNLTLLAFLTALAMKIIPYGKYFYLVMGMVPEVIYLYCSYSYDGLNLALCMLIMAYFLRLYVEKDKIGIKELLILGILLLLMIPVKIVYVFFGLLLFLLPIEKIALSKRQVIGIGVIGIAGVGAFIMLGILLVFPLLGNVNGVVDYSDQNALMTIGYVLENRERSLMVFFNTIFANTNLYFNNALGEIVGFGRYSGLDCYVLPMWMVCVIVFLMLVGLEDTRENIISGWKRALGIVMGIFIYLAVLTSMFFAFTSIVSHRIAGLQGRYFLPIFIILPFVVKNNFFEIKCSKKKLCLMGMGMINLVFTFLTFYHYVANYFL